VDLTDTQWELLAPLLPTYRRRKDGRGRPRKDMREVLNGVLWILRTGAQWADLPLRYPPYQTCHRYFQEWCRDGTLKRILHALAEDLHERGGIDISEAFIDGTFAGAKKGGSAVGKTKRGKGTKIMAIADRSGLPIAAGIASASPHETTLVEETIDNGFLEHAPDRLIGDRAYDSNALDERLRWERGIELIAPHLSTRRHKTQDGRPLRRYRRRWLIERLFAWLQNYRRLVTRWERHAENFLGFVQLGCICILLRHF
jgi:transposase